MREPQVVLALADLRADEERRIRGDELARRPARRRGQAAEGLLRQLDQLAVVHCARARDDDARARVVRVDVGLQVRARDAVDVGLGAQDRAAQAAVLVGRRVQQVKDDLLLVRGGRGKAAVEW